jgi:hypothetical protein
VNLKKAGEINGWNGPAHVIAGAFEFVQNSGISVVVILAIVYVLGREVHFIFPFLSAMPCASEIVV